MCGRIITLWRAAEPSHWFIVLVCGVLLLGFILPPSDATTVLGPTLHSRFAAGTVSQPLTLAPIQSTRQPTRTTRTSTTTVQPGDTLSAIFDRLNIGASTLARIMRLDAAKPLRTLHPGDTLKMTWTPDHQLATLQTTVNGNHKITLTRTDEGFNARQRTLATLHNTAYARGIVRTSLFSAAHQAGLSDAATMALIHLFAWDIDFGHDVRPGDHFTVIYQRTFNAHKGRGTGPILAAQFTAGGKTYTAIRYTDADGHIGYYSADGHNVRKAFLRAPVDYTRVSSGFSLHRMNPVLHRVRPHYGTDFAAPTGTPIHATADGRIIYRGRRGGYGNAVILKHAGRYSTLYAHMSRFVRGQHVGTEVHQGEVIGYVGQTGVATGPHCHYEFRINGAHKDPLKIKLPAAKPIAKKYRAAFKQHAQALLTQLNAVRHIRIAER